jgi:prepilin-type N-terminal cleavage/methylation domain-containing protein/prepilin-type processing-associated H-X9-DG protein
MNRQSGSFTLVEMLIVMAIIGILAGILLPALMSAREQSRRKICANNLGQIGKACLSYQEPNSDYFPAFRQSAAAGGSNAYDDQFQPMPSLACLYPTYCNEVKVFACPSTNDAPQIAVQYYNISTNVSALHTCFGFEWYDTTGVSPHVSPTDPAVYSGQEVSDTHKCSYLYDELVQPRDLTAEQAIAADADGQTWLLPGGRHPTYPDLPTWQRLPRKPNHDNGQNVMYIDGHVKWTDTVYCGQNRSINEQVVNDNVFCPNITGGIQWDPDIDAYLWDGAGADARAPGQ